MSSVVGENSLETLNGWFKEVYADKVEKLIPDSVMVSTDIKFTKRTKQLGNLYHQPVLLTHEHGFTYALADAGAFQISTPIAAVHKDATIQGVQMLLESRIDLESLSRAKDKTSFGSATAHLMENMVSSFKKRMEIEVLYGGDGSIYCGLGQIGSVVSGAGTTTLVVAIKAGHWAAGIWAGAENARVAVYDNNGTGGLPGATVREDSEDSNSIKVSAVDFANKRVSLTITGEADLDDVVADDFIFFHGAKANGMDGLVTIATSTGSLNGIDGAVYGLWRGNESAVGSLPLTFSATVKGHDAAVGRGLDEDVTLYVNPGAWTDIMTDQVALRRYDSSYSTRQLKQGTRGLQFEAQFGRITIKAHNMIKEGIALSLVTSSVMKVGSTDMTFKVPGYGMEHLYILPSNAGVGVRAYCNFAVFAKKLACNTLFTGIVNSA